MNLHSMQVSSLIAAAGAAGAGAGALASHTFDLPAPIASAIASVIIALGAAVIRWFERKVLKQQADNAAEKIAALQKDVDFWKAQSKKPYSGTV